MSAAVELVEKYALVVAFALVGVVMLVSYRASRLPRGDACTARRSRSSWIAGRRRRGLHRGDAKASPTFRCWPASALGGTYSGTWPSRHRLRRRIEPARQRHAQRRFAGHWIVCRVRGRVAGVRDPVTLTTRWAGAATYIVGPVTGAALGASSEIIALSIAAGW
jgi:hypothetical protein